MERITDYQSYVINSYDPSISSDGKYLVYTSFPSGYETVILFDVETEIRVEVASGNHPVISGDGRYIAFASDATDLVPNDTNGTSDIFVYDRLEEEITRVSVGTASLQATGGPSTFPSISYNGRYVAFESTADNLGGSGSIDVYVHDRTTATTNLVSQSTSGNPNYVYARGASISGDGLLVAFRSDAWNLVDDDTNNKMDVFLRNVAQNTTIRVSESQEGEEGNDHSDMPVISADGRFIAYSSLANNLVTDDDNGLADVFLYDRQTGSTSLVSVSSEEVQGDGSSGCINLSYVTRCLGISAHGRYISFPSVATNFFSGYNTFNTYTNVFLRDMQSGQTTLVSREYYGSIWGENGDDDSGPSTMSGDGRFVVFQSRAWLMGVEGPGNEDIFLFDQDEGIYDTYLVYLPIIHKNP